MSNILFPIYFIDPPEILEAHVTSIPGAGDPPMQIVEASGNLAAHGIQYIDTTDDYMGIYVGEEGSEVLKCIVGGGLNTATPVVIPAHSRVSIRSMTASPITNGNITITFLGYGWNGKVGAQT